MSRRRYVIGLDEAGYGPNLGPLVIGATVWSLPAELPTEELWGKLQDVLTNSPVRRDSRLHVADSKEVYQSQKGLHALERGVLSFVALTQPDPVERLFPLVEQLQGKLPETFCRQPWFQQPDCSLPSVISDEEIRQFRQKLQQQLTRTDIRLERIAVEVVCPERFNQQVEHFGNKSSLLSHTTFQLLTRVWPGRSTEVEVLADKHGGRNRYQEFLNQYFPEQFFLQEKETLEESRYRCGETSLAFAMRSERHLPVALASMTAKYVREICLNQFNQYWQTRIPGLKPTKGYPQDARRFREDIQGVLQESPDLIAVLWRNR